MAYKDKEKQRKYQREYIGIRKLLWFLENGPCVICGSWKELELDHIDPEQKRNHRVWSWSEDRRLVELSKCQVLCHKCHRIKTTIYRRRFKGHGIYATYKQGCRCKDCTLSNTIRVREWRKSHAPRASRLTAVVL